MTKTIGTLERERESHSLNKKRKVLIKELSYEKGITLVTLAITIIILLISAGVTVNFELRENEIIPRVKKSNEEYLNSKEIELIQLAIASAQIEGNGIISTENLNKELKINLSNNNIIVEELPIGWTFENNNQYIIFKNGNIEIDNVGAKNIYSKIDAEIQEVLKMGILIELQDITESNFYNHINNYSSGLVQIKNDNANIITSSIYSAGWDAYMAFDDSRESYWCTANYQQNDAYIGFDFEKKQMVSHCFYRCGSKYRAKEVKLQCSNDNVTWIDASETIKFSSKDNEKIIVNTKIKEGYRYWRIYVISAYTSYTVANDLQFFNTSINNIYNLDNEIIYGLINGNTTLKTDDIITNQMLSKLTELDNEKKEKIIELGIIDKFKEKKIGLIENLTNNENIITSSIYSTGYDAYMAFDNNNGSYWCTATSQQNDAYIGYNFNNKVYIDSAEIYSDAYRCKEVKLQCSNDGETWIDASEVMTFENDSEIHTIESNIKDTPYQYWRIYVIKGYNSQYTGIYECNFYGV